MPCYDPRDDEDKIENARLVCEYRVKIDNLTEMLCNMCAQTKFEDIPQNIRGWYSRHLEDDRKRVKQTFLEKFNKFSASVNEMTGEELRDLENKLDQIK